jgi:hypothetical protein
MPIPRRFSAGIIAGTAFPHSQGQQQTDLELADLLKPFPIEWDKQEAFFNSRAI